MKKKSGTESKVSIEYIPLNMTHLPSIPDVRRFDVRQFDFRRSDVGKRHEKLMIRTGRN